MSQQENKLINNYLSGHSVKKLPLLYDTIEQPIKVPSESLNGTLL